jgi:hypothetical protein
LVSYL